MAGPGTTASGGRSAGRGVLLAACVSALVVNANTSAVTILLPAISADLNTTVNRLQWAVTGYMLVGAAVIVSMQNYLAQIGAWVTVVQGVIFVICVLAFRRGIIGEIAHLLRKPL